MKQELPRDDDGQLSAFAWPGGYAIAYITSDGGVLCAKCAREAEAEGLTQDPDDKQWFIEAATTTDILDDGLDDNDYTTCDNCYKAIDLALQKDGEAGRAIAWDIIIVGIIMVISVFGGSLAYMLVNNIFLIK